ncbi:MAG: hypothetical protein R3248_00865 [Candidatus Promineifilaceae bacterium]|nr:hypothetical protein [Candidatus Promineifilaceae bacterium]
MKGNPRSLLRNFILEMILYGVLVVAYFLAVLRFLGEPLMELYESSLPLYAVAALILIVAQGVVLEWVTSFLVNLLGLERLE